MGLDIPKWFLLKYIRYILTIIYLFFIFSFKEFCKGFPLRYQIFMCFSIIVITLRFGD